MVTVSLIPTCGVLSAVTPIPEVDNNGDYIIDGTVGISDVVQGK